MAFSYSCSKALVVFFIVFSYFCCFSATSFEFEVGNNEGWAIPPANNSKLYNDWASKNRFQIGDTIHFKYEKDSVMVVTESEYKQCNSTHPTFFSNNGNTEFKFDRSGLFYFISGVSGHCERGQKMIIKVMAADDTPPGGDNSSASTINVVAASSVFAAIVVAQFASFCSSYGSLL